MGAPIPERKITSSSKSIDDYPRVLIIYMSCINQADQHGLSLRNWFADWPKENLAQIYSGGESGEEKFCGHIYKLGPRERKWGRLFYKLKGSSLGESSYPIILKEEQRKLGWINRSDLLQGWFSNILLNSGLWELIFRPILSSALQKW